MHPAKCSSINKRKFKDRGNLTPNEEIAAELKAASIDFTRQE